MIFYWSYNWPDDNGKLYKHFIMETKNYMFLLFSVKQKKYIDEDSME